MIRLITVVFLLALLFKAQLTVAQPADAMHVKPSVKAKQTEQSQPKPGEKSSGSNVSSGHSIDWGDWNTKLPSDQRYGVGIEGRVERLINQLDKSDLVSNADGVETFKREDSKPGSQPKNISEMMAELRAMEQKLKKEVEDDTEF